MQFNKPTKKKIIIKVIVFVLTIITIILSIVLSKVLLNESDKDNIYIERHTTTVIQDIELFNI